MNTKSLVHSLCFLACVIDPGSLMSQSFQQWILGTSTFSEEAYGMVWNGQQILLAVNEGIDSIGGTDTGIWTVDSVGQVIDRQVFGSPKDDFVRGFIVHPSGGYLMCGMRTSYTPFRQSAFLIRLSDSLQVHWEWNHPDSMSISELKSVTVSPSGMIMACGSISSPGEDLDPLILTFDPEGTLIQTSDNADTVNDLAHAVVAMGDGSWIIAGDRQMPDLTYRSTTMRITSNDSLIWRQIWDTGLNSGAQSLISLSDGNVLMIGETYPDTNSFYFDVFLRKMSPEGTELWMNTYGQSGADAGFAVVESPQDKELHATGYMYNESSASTEAFFLRTDRLGIQQEISFAGLEGIDYGNVILRAGNRYWLAGFSNVGTDSQVLLAKKSYDNPTLIPDVTVSHSATTAWPNPCRPGATVSLDIKGNQPELVQVTDLFGRSLTCNWILEGQVLMVTMPEEPGIYIISLVFDEQTSVIRCMVK